MGDTYKAMWDNADFENKIRYNHLDSLLCDIDDQLMELYIDKICTELEIEIARVLGEYVEDLGDELFGIDEEIGLLDDKYDVVLDFFDEELFVMLAEYERVRKDDDIDEMFG